MTAIRPNANQRTRFPAIPPPGGSQGGLIKTVDTLKQAVELLTGQAGDSTTTAATISAIADVVRKTVANDSTIKDVIDEANRARAEAFLELQEALTDLAQLNGEEHEELVGQITSLGVRVDDNQAAIFDAEVARVTADDALAGAISSLTTTVNSNTAAITSESVARSEADASIAATVSTLTSTANRAVTHAQPSAPSSNLKVGDLWMDTDAGNKLYRWDGSAWQPVDNTDIAQNAAAITNEATARATADSSLATAISTVSSRVDNNSSSISVQQSSINGISAQFSVTGNINGVTGKFSFGGVRKLDGTVSYVAEIQGNLIVDGSIVGDKVAANTITGNKIAAGTVAAANMVANNAFINDLSIQSLKLGDNAVTVPVYATSGTAVGGTGMQNLCYAAFNIDTTGLGGKPLYLFIDYTWSQNTQPSTAWAANLICNGTVLRTIGGLFQQVQMQLTGVYPFIANGGMMSFGVAGTWESNNPANNALQGYLRIMTTKR